MKLATRQSFNYQSSTALTVEEKVVEYLEISDSETLERLGLLTICPANSIPEAAYFHKKARGDKCLEKSAINRIQELYFEKIKRCHEVTAILDLDIDDIPRCVPTKIKETIEKKYYEKWNHLSTQECKWANTIGELEIAQSRCNSRGWHQTDAHELATAKLSILYLEKISTLESADEIRQIFNHLLDNQNRVKVAPYVEGELVKRMRHLRPEIPVGGFFDEKVTLKEVYQKHCQARLLGYSKFEKIIKLKIAEVDFVENHCKSATLAGLNYDLNTFDNLDIQLKIIDEILSRTDEPIDIAKIFMDIDLFCRAEITDRIIDKWTTICKIEIEKCQNLAEITNFLYGVIGTNELGQINELKSAIYDSSADYIIAKINDVTTVDELEYINDYWNFAGLNQAIFNKWQSIIATVDQACEFYWEYNDSTDIDIDQITSVVDDICIAEIKQANQADQIKQIFESIREIPNLRATDEAIKRVRQIFLA